MDIRRVWQLCGKSHISRRRGTFFLRWQSSGEGCSAGLSNLFVRDITSMPGRWYDWSENLTLGFSTIYRMLQSSIRNCSIPFYSFRCGMRVCVIVLSMVLVTSLFLAWMGIGRGTYSVDVLILSSSQRLPSSSSSSSMPSAPNVLPPTVRHEYELPCLNRTRVLKTVTNTVKTLNSIKSFKRNDVFKFPHPAAQPCYCTEDVNSPLSFCADHLGKNELVCLVSLSGITNATCKNEDIPCVLEKSCLPFRSELVFAHDEVYRRCKKDSFIRPGPETYHARVAEIYVAAVKGEKEQGKTEVFRSFRNHTVIPQEDKYMGKFANKTLKAAYFTEEFLPSGVQDMGGGTLDNFIIYTGGFCGGPLCCAYFCAPRGHLYFSYALDVTSADTMRKGWRRIPRFPGGINQGRQGMGCATSLTNPQVFVCIGGYSYVAARTMAGTLKPKESVMTYQEVFGLRYQAATATSQNSSEASPFAPGKWWWERFPDYPHKTCFPSVVAWGSYIIVVGGCQGTEEGLDCFSTPSVPMIGSRIFRLDVSRQGSTWEELQPILGTPRAYASISIVEDNMYIFFGAVGITKSNMRYFNAADNWVMNLKSQAMTRLPSGPVGVAAATSNAVAFGRYIVIFGASLHPLDIYEKGNCTFEQSVVATPTYQTAMETEFSKSVLVYDVVDKVFGYTNPLPLGLNYPTVVRRPGTDNEFFVFGGEADVTPIFGVEIGRHSALNLRVVLSKL